MGTVVACRVGLLALMAISAFSLGCGKAASTLPPAYSPPSAQPMPQPSPGQPVAPGDLGQDVAAWVAEVAKVSEGTLSYKAEARTDMRLPDGGTDFNVSRLRYRRPGWVRAEILQAKQNGKKGTIVVFDGKREVRVKTYLFGLLAVRATLDVRDKRLLDAYQRSLADTSTEALMATFLDPKATHTWAGEGQAAGEAVVFLDVFSPSTYKGITRDRYAISKRLHLPIQRDSFDAQKRLQFHCELRQMQRNVAMGPDDFTTD